MKKILILMLIIIITGCSKIENDENKENLSIDGIENVIKATTYIDDNQTEIGLYKKINGKYFRQSEYISSFPSLKDISLFSIILSNQEEEIGSVKSLYNNYISNNPDFFKYKIGYQIIVNLNNGESIKETILKPKYFTNYDFSNYLYIWLYDDINNSGWYSHIEEEQYNENTVMTSIKLMATELGSKDIKDVELTVFTYDENDFDSDDNYRGNSSHAIIIKR